MHVPQTEVILRHDGTELARVILPPGAGCQALTDISPLKRLPDVGDSDTAAPRTRHRVSPQNAALADFSYNATGKLETAEEFWAAYDAKQAAEKK
jgi:hypothetical protein